MVDTAPSSSKFKGSKNYYRGAHRYEDGSCICDKCQYADNKTCGMCAFAVWNIDGVMAGFSPDKAYREAHKNDVRDSPMMQKFSMDTVEARATNNEAKTKIRHGRLIAKLANDFLESQGFHEIRVNEDMVQRQLGRSPIENGSPNLTSLPKVLTPYPAMPTRADTGPVIQRLYEVRKNLDH
jgi:hypothetical protein